MTETASAGDAHGAARLGLSAGQIVTEFGYDDDVDHGLREAIEDIIGSDLMEEDSDEVVDAVVLWWRDGDGDLADMLVDTLGTLTTGGTIWLLTPKVGRAGHLDPSEAEEAAPAVGLHATSTISVCEDWAATRLVQPKGMRRSS